MFLGRLHPSEHADEAGFDFSEWRPDAPPLHRPGDSIGELTLTIRGQHVRAELLQPGDTARSDQIAVRIDGGPAKIMSLRALMLAVSGMVWRTATKRQLLERRT